MCLILKMHVKYNKGTPSVNNTTDREVTPEYIQFGLAFLCILQVIWEEGPDQDLARVYNLYISYS